MPESYPNDRAVWEGESAPEPSLRKKGQYNYELNVLLNLEKLLSLSWYYPLPMPVQHAIKLQVQLLTGISLGS